MVAEVTVSRSNVVVEVTVAAKDSRVAQAEVHTFAAHWLLTETGVALELDSLVETSELTDGDVAVLLVLEALNEDAALLERVAAAARARFR